MRPLHDRFAQRTGRKQLGLFIGETFFKGFSLFETATLHRALRPFPCRAKTFAAIVRSLLGQQFIQITRFARCRRRSKCGPET
jgi:hypothetical protein